LACNKLLFMKAENIYPLFQCFKNKNILIIGDVMIDSYMCGSVERISPEAPIPIVTIKERENRLGGAANVGLNIKSLGATPMMCSVIGEDKYAGEFMELLENQGMRKTGIMTSKSRKTTVKTRIISSNQHLLRVDEENTDALDDDTKQSFINHIESLLNSESIDAIIFEDYDKGLLSPEIIEYVIDFARRNTIPVTADPKQKNFHAYRGVDLFKPNHHEMKSGLKTDFAKDNLPAIRGLGTKLVQDMQLKYLLLTIADAGAVIMSRDSMVHSAAKVRDIADVSGAGDTVIATATLCLVCGLGMHEVVCIANLAGGLVCKYSGVVPINREVLMNALEKMQEE
jgi:D-glycero-beta-D-manno-heptose-7-phosphate kinase